MDANVFVGQAQRGRALLASGEVAAAREILAQALAEWHGPAYSDIEDWEFAQIEATRLEAVRAAAVDDHLAASSACGDHESVIVDLSALLCADPLRERRWELLALTQYRAGRQAQALESLRTARNVLADIERALGTDRLVTLTGPGGIGKTRLAMAVAAAHFDHDGPWFVEVSGARDHDSLVEAMVRVLGVTAGCGSVFPVSMSTLSDRCARPRHCSPNAPLALRVPRIRPTSSPCVRLSTICLWQSNSLPRGPRCCRCDNCTTC